MPLQFLGRTPAIFAECYMLLQCVTVRDSVWQCFGSALQCVAVRLQGVTVCCSGVAVCCGALQCVAVCCSVLQCVAANHIV